MTKGNRKYGSNTDSRAADGKFGPGNPNKRENELMAKPKVKAKAKAKIAAKEKKARATRAAFNKVCDLIADGPKESVKEITADNSIGISRSGFYYLLKGRDDEVLDRYAQARAMQADRLAGEIISIADGASKDTVNQARLQFDARRWMAGKLAPKTYGERQTVNMSHNNLDNETDDELLARAKKLADGLGITLPANLLKPAKHRSGGG